MVAEVVQTRESKGVDEILGHTTEVGIAIATLVLAVARAETRNVAVVEGIVLARKTA
jgi:hypothetical protein